MAFPGRYWSRVFLYGPCHSLALLQLQMEEPVSPKGGEANADTSFSIRVYRSYQNSGPQLLGCVRAMQPCGEDNSVDGFGGEVELTLVLVAEQNAVRIVGQVKTVTVVIFIVVDRKSGVEERSGEVGGRGVN